jgi:type IV pilus assembly protein PilA
MKRCPVCNAVYPHNHAFCKADGTALVETQDVAAGIPQDATQGWPQPPVAKRRVPVFVWVLVGVAVFFIVVIVPILALIAIPTLVSVKKQANELGAKKSILAIQQAELMYSTNYPSYGYACSLRALGGDPNAGSPSADAAQLLPNDLTSGFKDGYIFTISNCTSVSQNGTERVTGYQITAVPETPGKTGSRGFCSDADGAIKYDPTGGTQCVQPLESR